MCSNARNKHKTVPNQGSLSIMLKQMVVDFMKCMIVQIHWLFDIIVDFCFGLYYDSKVQRVPPVKNKLLLESGCSLAKKIREGTVSAEEVVRTFIDRCKEVNGLLNTIVVECYESAIKEAQEVDKLLKTDVDREILRKTKPYLGVPFTTKESNEAKGLKHSMGMICRRDHISTEDATVVGLLKEAGAIIIAKTNIPEMNLWIESRNNVYGQTNNPYDTTRTVGGSSGGEGAIVAACGSAISIGSDIGGSTRIPSFCNGVFGHKPSEGTTSTKGIGMRSENSRDTMVGVGPMCKNAEDLLPLLKIYVGENISMLKLDSQVDVKNLKVFYQVSSGDIRSSSVSKEMRSTLMKAVRHFEQVTGSATKIKMPGSEYSYRIWRYWMTQEKGDFRHLITNRKSVTSARAEVMKLVSCQSELTLAAILKLSDMDFLPQENADWARFVTSTLKKFLLDKLSDNGILLYTSSPNSVPYHYASYLKPFNFGYFCLFNALRFPVCQVPMGLDRNGLPTGIQVVAAPYNDHLCLAVAKELERAFGGWVPPS
ncbi:fatty-acid amide hydrolase 2 [Leptopilina heterotoma]|uniref:fatty-acid amide hydrolase 2 n=1 Tax=Leptopilina heterotoma TaxID=63436 RepID=UPI001CA88952|nr:fatty-acid amide hydrolase 2 [Leptopilina heterotoma]